MLKKLRNQFLAVTMVLVSVMLLVIFSLVYYFTANNLEEQSINIARAAAQSAMQPGFPGGRQEESLPTFTVEINIFGHLTISGSSYYDLTNEELVRELLRQVEANKQISGVLEDYDLRFYRDVGCIAFVDISAHKTTLSILRNTSIAIGVFSFALFYLISFLLANRAVRPVEKAWNQQRQFVSDASHELKTPLAIITSNAELLQSQADDTEKYRSNILMASDQMRRLVEGLLELARADNGQIKKHFALLNFSKLTQDICLAFEAVFYENALELESNIQSDVLVMGNAQYLYQVVDILLDNARKYSIPGTVTVCLQRQGSACLLSVSNPGEPIPAKDKEKLFERFYRADKARTGTGGFGLGLAIAKSVVDEHGGSIWVESNGGQNTFFVQLPAVREKSRFPI